MKRKIRELKKLEIKLREKNNHSNNDGSKHVNIQNSDLIWNKYFNEKSKESKYNIQELLRMSKEEFKDVITEYFYYLYHSLYQESGLADESYIDIELLTSLGLPIYTDYNELKRKFRELAKKNHPDNGGDRQKFIELMEQFKNIRK